MVAETPNVTSPRLTRLLTEVKAGEADAFDRFWDEVVVGGTPLVEPDDDHRYRIVTFLYRPESDLEPRDVLTIVHTLTDRDRHEGNLSSHLMTRLPGTPLWYRSYRMRADLRASYQLLPCRDEQIDPTGMDDKDWQRAMTQARPDPYNRRVFPALGDDYPPTSLVELPDAPPQPWWRARAGVPCGAVSAHRLASDRLGNERDVWVYAPPGHQADPQHRPAQGPYPLLVLFDGDVWGPRLDIWSTLDNLIAEERIPPMVAVAVDSMDNDTRMRELFCHQPFVDFLTAELLPWLADRWHITAAADRTILAGQSAGGLTAAFAALQAPHRFGNVLSQSGSYWWRGDTEFDTGAEWLTREYASAPRHPVRFYLEVGLQEWKLLRENRHLRDVLTAKGYDLAYAEYNGGHDYACWRGGLADGLLALTSHWT